MRQALFEVVKGNPMKRSSVFEAVAVSWAACGIAIGAITISTVNSDARWLVGVFAVLGPLLAVVATRLVARSHARSAGLLLALSAVVTPTYFAYVVGVPALVAGIWLAVRPRVIGDPSDRQIVGTAA